MRVTLVLYLFLLCFVHHPAYSISPKMSASNQENLGKGKEEPAGLKDGIDELINQERVVIFSKSTCPYCDDAKKVFDKLGQSYSTIDLNDHPNGGEVQSVLKEMTGAGTVPRVFVDGKCIGGGSDTVELFQNGKLEQILKTRSAESMPPPATKESQHGSGEPKSGF